MGGKYFLFLHNTQLAPLVCSKKETRNLPQEIPSWYLGRDSNPHAFYSGGF